MTSLQSKLAGSHFERAQNDRERIPNTRRFDNGVMPWQDNDHESTDSTVPPYTPPSPDTSPSPDTPPSPNPPSSPIDTSHFRAVSARTSKPMKELQQLRAILLELKSICEHEELNDKERGALMELAAPKNGVQRNIVLHPCTSIVMAIIISCLVGMLLSSAFDVNRTFRGASVPTSSPFTADDRSVDRIMRAVRPHKR